MSIANAEPSQNTAEPTQMDGQHVSEPSHPVRQFSAKQIAARFTVENARAMSAKANAAKRARIEALREAANPSTLSEEEYRKTRLARIRTQLTELEELLKGQVDWKAIKAISDAIARLSVIEQNLAGRPLPGSHRPVKEKERKPAFGQGPAPVDAAEA